MIEVPTVLILGAGSSRHVGYPLGGELKAKLCAKESRLGDDEILVGRWDTAAFEAFRISLSRSFYGSIDAFLEENPAHLDLGKYLIARELKRSEMLDHLFSPHDPGWYEYLGRKLLSHGPDRLGDNNVSIITFNYDRSLECYLHQILQHQFRLSENEATSRLGALRFLHMHGILGDYPSTPYSSEASPNELVRISQEIKIIHEIEDASEGFCSDAFRTANSWLEQAERIIFLGFGFHNDNVRRFNFFTPDTLKGKEVDAATAGIGANSRHELDKRLKEFGIEFRREIGYQCGNLFEHVLSLNQCGPIESRVRILGQQVSQLIR